MSYDQKVANGKARLVEALAQSDTVSIRSWGGGGVLVYRNVEVKADEFCGDLIASKVSFGGNEFWVEFDRSNNITNECGGFGGIDSVRPREVRHCKFSDCLWMRGVG